MDDRINVLLVEDNRGDVILATESLKRAGIDYQVYTAEDGIQALAFLYNEPPFADAPTPDLIILDINLPRLNGCEVLTAIAGDSELAGIPLVIFTSAFGSQQDLPCYEADKHLFLTKPGNFPGYVEAMREIEEYRKSKAR